MARQKMGLLSTLAAVGVVGAAAGLAWRWAQRYRTEGVAPHRELSRWEDEGGSLASAGDSAPQSVATAPPMSAGASVAPSSNGEIQDAWPFPSSTRH